MTEEPRVVGLPQLIGSLLKLFALALVAATPLLGVWVASSVAAHQNGSTAFAFVVGAMLFPVGPLLWELWASGGKTPRKSKLIDRLILRTLFLNIVALSLMIGTRPKLAFVALSTRGDWFLEGHSGPEVERTRAIVFAVASKLEWLYLAVQKNPYREPPKTKEDGTPAPKPVPQPVVEDHPVHAPPGDPTAPKWPLPATPHPIVAAIPPSAEESIGSVGFYIAEHERDPLQRIKALHDYVTDRVAYDFPALALPRIPYEDGDAESVFKNKKGVCSGYAHLLEALGRVTGDEIIYVVGNSRHDEKEDQGGAGHAWNAVKLAGKWYLIDPTWDAGYGDDNKFVKRYSTLYLFTRPDAFSLDHFPDEERWQLRDHPLSRGDFMRQPMMTPQFVADDFELLEPDRSQVTVDSVFEAKVRNRDRRFMMAMFSPKSGGPRQKCDVQGDTIFTIHCTPPTTGEYQVLLFGGTEEYGTYGWVGRIDVNRR